MIFFYFLKYIFDTNISKRSKNTKKNYLKTTKTNITLLITLNNSFSNRRQITK